MTVLLDKKVAVMVLDAGWRDEPEVLPGVTAQSGERHQTHSL